MPGYMYSYIKQGRSVSSLRCHIINISIIIFLPIIFILIAIIIILILIIINRRPIEPYDRKTSHPPMHFHLPSDKSRKVF